MRGLLTYFLGAALILGTAVCSGDETPESVARARVEIESATSYPSRHPPVKAVAVAWAIIPGGLNGRTNSVFFTSLIDESASFSVDLDETEAALRRAAVRATGESLVIEPADTRIARLATGAYPPTQPQNILGAEVLEPKSKKALLVFYVNKPCHLSGQMPLEGRWGGPQAPYELDIPRAGLTWVTSEAIDGKVLLILVQQPKEFVYVIFDDR